MISKPAERRSHSTAEAASRPRRMRRVDYRKMVFRGVLALLILYVVVLGTGQYFRSAALNADIGKLTGELRAAREKTAALQRKVELLQTAEYVEKLAREKLGFVYPGETLYMTEEPKRINP